MLHRLNRPFACIIFLTSEKYGMTINRFLNSWFVCMTFNSLVARSHKLTHAFASKNKLLYTLTNHEVISICYTGSFDVNNLKSKWSWSQKEDGQCFNRLFYSCVLSCLAFDWKWGWSWPCLRETSVLFLCKFRLISMRTASLINIRKTRPTPA